MKKQLDSVAEFHNAFSVRNEKDPMIIPYNLWNLRADMMQEELDEYKEACKEEKILEVADALADQLYILCGTILAHGMQDIIEDVFNEVHRSNMSKLGIDGKPVLRADGKVLKGPDYFKPDIGKYI